MTEKLLQWTGERWIISLSKNNDAKSIFEKKQESKIKLIENFKKGELAKEVEAAFPDIELVDIEIKD